MRLLASPCSTPGARNELDKKESKEEEKKASLPSHLNAKGGSCLEHLQRGGKKREKTRLSQMARIDRLQISLSRCAAPAFKGGGKEEGGKKKKKGKKASLSAGSDVDADLIAQALKLSSQRGAIRRAILSKYREKEGGRSGKKKGRPVVTPRLASRISKFYLGRHRARFPDGTGRAGRSKKGSKWKPMGEEKERGKEKGGGNKRGRTAAPFSFSYDEPQLRRVILATLTALGDLVGDEKKGRGEKGEGKRGKGPALSQHSRHRRP